MPFRALLDASVLYPLPLRDTLLRVAEAELYLPHWSARILKEVADNLVEDGRANDEQAAKLIKAMDGAFEDAAVGEEPIARLEPAMINDPKDRHVLAAAVVGGAEVIVTLDLGGFPTHACEPFSIEPLHPDVFLLDMYELEADAVTAALQLQLNALRRPPLTREELLDRLAQTAPNFAAAVRGRG